MSLTIDQAVTRLKAGGLVAIPTETVYGLAADARNPAALKEIFRIKERPSDHPLIVHIALPHAVPSDARAWSKLLSEWARDVPPEALALAEQFWPGPLTLVLPKARGVLDEVTGGQDTVGLRCPDHPLTLELLARFGGGLAAPSANRFGRLSPTLPSHVRQEFAEEDVPILEGGACTVGIESTILDLSRLATQGPQVLRPGMLTSERLGAYLEKPLSTGDEHAPRVSGSLSAHYAPATPMVFADAMPNTFDSSARVAWLHFKASALPMALRNCAITAFGWEDHPQDLARALYGRLRSLDQGQFDCIVIDTLPKTLEWAAIQDRLTRAVEGAGVGITPAIFGISGK